MVLIVILLFSNSSNAFATFEIRHTIGKDRYETSVLLSRNNFPPGTRSVVIATGSDFADALAGGPLASSKGAPLLLTKKNALPKVVVEELIRLQATHVTLLGGEGVISADIDYQLYKMGIEVDRIQGSDRYDTAAMIARVMNADKKAYIVTGTDFPDALSVSALAGGRSHRPILLVSKNSIPETTSKVITELQIETCIIVGGEGVISPAVAAKLPGSIRLSGKNRYETSAVVARYSVTNGFAMERIHIVSGINYPDALSAGPIAGKDTGAVLLTDPLSLSNDASEFIELTYDELLDVVIVGGEGAVSQNVTDDLHKLNKTLR